MIGETAVKIALYIEDGLEQIVLTPESETEDGILGKLHDGTREMSIKRGTFYGCQGGWVRWKRTYANSYGQEDEDGSTMIVLRRKEPEQTRVFDVVHIEP